MRLETSLKPQASSLRRSRRSFTLVELISVIAVSSIVGGIASLMILTASKQRSEVAARCELVDNAARAMEQMIRYIREIPQDSGLTGDAQLTTANTSDIRWSTYGFRLSGSTLEMTIDTAANWRPAAKEVTSLTITYFDKDGNTLSPLPLTLTNREAVRRVRIRIVMTRGAVSTTIQTSVYLRAFMNEVLSA